MITKEQLSAAMTRECDISVHLFEKLTPGSFDFSPAPGQRNTTELLRYLSICGIAGIRCMADANWKQFGDFVARSKDMKPEEFPAAMLKQKGEIAAFFETTSEKVLETQDAPLPGGGSMPLAAAILNGPFKWLAAYKLQLFLYAKATGAPEIGTANAWMGIDWKK